jgi:hypothetical protein
LLEGVIDRALEQSGGVAAEALDLVSAPGCSLDIMFQLRDSELRVHEEALDLQETTLAFRKRAFPASS